MFNCSAENGHVAFSTEWDVYTSQCPSLPPSSLPCLYFLLTLTGSISYAFMPAHRAATQTIYTHKPHRVHGNITFIHCEQYSFSTLLLRSFFIWINALADQEDIGRKKNAEREVERLDYTHFTLNDTTGVLPPPPLLLLWRLLLLLFFRMHLYKSRFVRSACDSPYSFMLLIGL